MGFRLQTEIALSTAESEYAALSHGMRTLLPLRVLLFEVAEYLDLPVEQMSTISHVWEDNMACQLIATANPPRLTARNKHWSIKHHWFRSHLGDDTIVVKHVASADQLADIFTKALVQRTFEGLRDLLQGWEHFDYSKL